MKFAINKYLLDDIENINHPSSFELTKEYSLLILRLPFIKNDLVEIFSYVFLIKENRVYRYIRDTKEFEELGSFSDLYNYLDVRVDKILAKIAKLQAYIEDLEDALYEDSIDRDFPEKWLLYKKDLSLIERLMGHSILAFERFMKHYKKELNEFEYNDLYEHLQRTHNLSKSNIEKLDNLYNFYRAKSDEKMNNIMFVLTIISAIFMPLTLVTGYFGMNTGGLPFTEDPEGTLKVSIWMLVFEIPFVVAIWLMMKRA
jgi:magnesium transporter